MKAKLVKESVAEPVKGPIYKYVWDFEYPGEKIIEIIPYKQFHIKIAILSGGKVYASSDSGEPHIIDPPLVYNEDDLKKQIRQNIDFLDELT